MEESGGDLLTHNSSLPPYTHQCVQTLLGDVTPIVCPVFCSEKDVLSGGLKAQIVSNDLCSNLGFVSSWLGGLPNLCLSLLICNLDLQLVAVRIK